MTDERVFLVGGAVRDGILGVRTKDYDYTYVPSEEQTSVGSAFDEMRDFMVEEGYHIFTEAPHFFTIRAKFPKDHALSGRDADFVLARKEGPYTDQRHPDWVKPGTLSDDLERRDFTINAMAQSEDGTIIDLFGGQDDLRNRTLRAVGDPYDRLMEDPLRAFRAFRFAVTKGVYINHELSSAIQNHHVLDSMHSVSTERIREELHRMFAFSSLQSMTFLVNNYPRYLDLIDKRGLWFEPTVKTAKGAK